MWVTTYNPFISNLGIDKNWHRIGCTYVFIIHWLFFLNDECHLCKPQLSVLSYTDCKHIMTSADLNHWKFISTYDIAWSSTYFGAEC